jgi:hypothetical protein
MKPTKPNGQQDLFEWTPPAAMPALPVADPVSAEIALFPMSRRQRVVRRHAQRIAVEPMTFAEIEAYLDKAARLEGLQLRRLNLPKAIVERELEAMRHAIVAEASRIERAMRNGGAA